MNKTRKKTQFQDYSGVLSCCIILITLKRLETIIMFDGLLESEIEEKVVMKHTYIMLVEKIHFENNLPLQCCKFLVAFRS